MHICSVYLQAYRPIPLICLLNLIGEQEESSSPFRPSAAEQAVDPLWAELWLLKTRRTEHTIGSSTTVALYWRHVATAIHATNSFRINNLITFPSHKLQTLIIRIVSTSAAEPHNYQIIKIELKKINSASVLLIAKGTYTVKSHI